MAYNLGYDEINPLLMKKLVFNYNNSPHSTLTKLLRIKTTPLQAHNNPLIEKEIIDKINEKNYQVKAQENYYIREGKEVAVYNDKHPLVKRRTVIKPYIYKIIDTSTALFKLRNLRTGEIIQVPRYKIEI